MLQSLKATYIIIAKKMLNSNGASTQPCLVPLVTMNGKDVMPPSRTRADIPSWNVLSNIYLSANFGKDRPEPWSIHGVKRLG